MPGKGKTIHILGGESLGAPEIKKKGALETAPSKGKCPSSALIENEKRRDDVLSGKNFWGKR